MLDTTKSLSLYENAKQALAEVHRVDEIKGIRDKAVAMQMYAKQAKDRELIDHATDIRLRAERRGGEILREMAQRGERDDGRGNRNPSLKSQTATPKLDDLGVTKTQSSRWQRLAELPEDKFEAKVSSAKDKAVASLDKASEFAHRTSFTGDNQWFTPSEYIEMARRVLGTIDLDPASHDLAQERIRASRYFTAADDGLTQPWFGNVWLNPPYAQPAISDFVEKIAAEYELGSVRQAIVLTHNYTDTAWFQRAAQACRAICFTRGRVQFEDPDGEVAAPTQGQAFFYFGEDPGKFAKEFGAVGFIAEVLR